MKKIPWMIRQGDVLVMQIDARPQGDWKRLRRSKDKAVVLANGEVTGHRHVVRDPGVCMLRAEGIGDRVMTVAREALLTHEEHSPISIPKGEHIVRIQREWAGEISRRVED